MPKKPTKDKDGNTYNYDLKWEDGVPAEEGGGETAIPGKGVVAPEKPKED